jgi:hypothetical protein
MRNILLTVILGAAMFTASGQAEKVQASFVYNFTKYIEWPTSTKSGNFVIGVYGNSPIYEELVKVAESKSAGSQPIVVKKIGSAGEITNQHMLFVAANKSREVGEIVSKIGSKPTLIITESTSTIDKGVAINFVLVDNKQRFELKRESLTDRGLKISAELEKFAILR